MVRANLVLAKWEAVGHLPSFDEYQDATLDEFGIYLTLISLFMGMDHDICKKEAYEWLKSRDKLVRAITLISRVANDMFGYQDDMSRGYMTGSVNCYKKQYGVTEEEAFTKLSEMMVDASKMLNDEFLKPINVPNQVLKVVNDLSRTIYVFYNKYDGLTRPAKVKNHITYMFVDMI
ncbi:unnamed protein product [Microthlaspi erraticum]|uniref:Terpene synthase metal-binding domain-containing protein n=1 Tax=Microthlaspi erraticum TaxID=1685480 RepID=A0A6D2K243_9BRAS|nr:unnamed protein product [Microthlaspi erraticum]